MSNWFMNECEKFSGTGDSNDENPFSTSFYTCFRSIWLERKTMSSIFDWAGGSTTVDAAGIIGRFLNSFLRFSISSYSLPMSAMRWSNFSVSLWYEKWKNLLGLALSFILTYWSSSLRVAYDWLTGTSSWTSICCDSPRGLYKWRLDQPQSWEKTPSLCCTCGWHLNIRCESYGRSPSNWFWRRLLSSLRWLRIRDSLPIQIKILPIIEFEEGWAP